MLHITRIYFKSNEYLPRIHERCDKSQDRPHLSPHAGKCVKSFLKQIIFGMKLYTDVFNCSSRFSAPKRKRKIYVNHRPLLS